jgi:hypothetical protein
VIDQPSHAGNRAVGRDGDALARHQVRIVGPAERTGIRRAELREMKTVEDLAAGAIQSGSEVSFAGSMRGCGPCFRIQSRYLPVRGS